MTPRVTIAIPAYNAMPYLRQTVESVLRQTHENIDLVVVDDNSSDETKNYLDSLTDERVRIVHNETNLGPEGNWNKALEHVRGDYFKLLCHDDYLEPEAIAIEVAALAAHPTAVMTACKRHLVDERDFAVMRNFGLAPSWSGLVDGVSAIRTAVSMGGNPIGEPSAVLLRGDVLSKVGKFDAQQPYCIDVDYWTRALRHGDLFAIRQRLCSFRLGSTSWSHALARKQREQGTAFLRRLASDDALGISRARMWQGIAVIQVISRGRRLIYRLLALFRKHPSSPRRTQKK